MLPKRFSVDDLNFVDDFAVGHETSKHPTQIRRWNDGSSARALSAECEQSSAKIAQKLTFDDLLFIFAFIFVLFFVEWLLFIFEYLLFEKLINPRSYCGIVHLTTQTERIPIYAQKNQQPVVVCTIVPIMRGVRISSIRLSRATFVLFSRAPKLEPRIIPRQISFDLTVRVRVEFSLLCHHHNHTFDTRLAIIAVVTPIHIKRRPTARKTAAARHIKLFGGNWRRQKNSG